ncbi:hypothetical protein VNO80_22928 [Phaseolus coccineus]|uniref:Uncharacterized protein n=1 Tax=Phaseolus coccineus TaxID=3886 RepID=A0AAN9M506_PHACN
MDLLLPGNVGVLWRTAQSQVAAYGAMRHHILRQHVDAQRRRCDHDYAGRYGDPAASVGAIGGGERVQQSGGSDGGVGHAHWRTGVNLILVGMWKSLVPGAKPISFNMWFFFGFPVAILFLFFFCFWCIICFFYVSNNTSHALSSYLTKPHLKRDLQALGNFDHNR